jgi:hypothetical protein
MILVAIEKPPPDQERAAKVLAETLNGPIAEARMRVAAQAPALIARLEDDAARSLAGALVRSGVAAVTIPEPVPTDADRCVARAIQFEPGSTIFSPRNGPMLGIPDDELALIVRGVRVTTIETTKTEKQRKFSLGTAIVTQGLKTSRTEEKTVRDTQENTEHFVIVFGRNGECAAVYDTQVTFQSLGSALQSTKLGNMNWIGEELRRRGKKAVFDDRLVRLGRRMLPFIVPGGGASSAGGVTVARTETASSVDVLAAALFAAVREGKLP